MTISRREFIGTNGETSGYGAAFMTMHSLGLWGWSRRAAERFPLPAIGWPRDKSD